MSKQKHIFATKEDLIQGLKSIEMARPLKYVLIGDFETPAIPTFTSLLAYTELGINKTGNHVAGDCFLIVDVGTEINVEKKVNTNGKLWYSVYPNQNQASITFRPGGIFDKKHLICGHIGTVYTEIQDSVNLFREFSTALLKKFKKVKSYYVGPEAEKMLHKGARLITISINSPPEYDLKL